VLPDSVPLVHNANAESLSQAEFRASDLFVYHCAGYDPTLETLLSLERGVVILWLQCQEDTVASRILSDKYVRLASASDIVVVDDAQQEHGMLDTGAADPARIVVVSPAVSLADFSPGAVDLNVRRNLGLLGKRVLLLHLPPVHAPSALNAAFALLDGVQSKCGNTVLLIVRSTEDSEFSPESKVDREDVLILPADAELLPVYRLADLCLDAGRSCGPRQRVLEAMACGTPVLSKEPDGPYSVESALTLLCDDAAYGKLVKDSLETAIEHSLEAFAEAWTDVLVQACGWLPVRLTPEASSAKPAVIAGSDGPTEEIDEASIAATLGIDIEQLRTLANVTLPDYEVRSPTPVVGPLIAWVRRNLTSHLRKPYLDPTLERQETFNLRAASVLEELALQLAAYERMGNDGAARSAAVNAQVRQMLELAQGRVETILEDDEIGEASRAQADAIRTALEETRHLLDATSDE
jgi:hypothetical protein